MPLETQYMLMFGVIKISKYMKLKIVQLINSNQFSN